MINQALLNQKLSNTGLTLNEKTEIVEATNRIVCAKTGIPIDIMKGRSRKRDIVEARQISMTLLKEFTDLSLKAIGREFGGRDHSTVIHAKDTIADLCVTSKQVRKVYTECRELLESVITINHEEIEPVINAS